MLTHVDQGLKGFTIREREKAISSRLAVNYSYDKDI